MVLSSKRFGYLHFFADISFCKFKILLVIASFKMYRKSITFSPPFHLRDVMTTNEQDIKLRDWVKSHLPVVSFNAIQGDASSRRYFRVNTGDIEVIAVHASPLTENNVAFVNVAHAFREQQVNVPEILQVNYDNGFLLLSDLGDTQLLKVLNQENVHIYYGQAFEDIIKIQSCHRFADWELPSFNEALLLKELRRFDEWYLEQHLNLTLSSSDWKMLHHSYVLLIELAQNQPQVCVHRDFHSRNLMVLNENKLGVLDFQDAVRGPVTYDLVSLLRDCYIEWPLEQVYKWVSEFALLSKPKQNQDEYQQWFDWIGLQRHLKVLGIFARLYRRDNKNGYLKDIPRILRYVLNVCDKYPEFRPLRQFLTARVLPYESDDISSGSGNPVTTING